MPDKLQIPVLLRTKAKIAPTHSWGLTQLRLLAIYLYTACPYSILQDLFRGLLPGLEEEEISTILYNKLPALISRLEEK